MSTIMKSARGASAYVYFFSRPSDGIGVDSADAGYQYGQQWESLIDELLRIRKFNDDWDGEGGRGTATQSCG